MRRVSLILRFAAICVSQVTFAVLVFPSEHHAIGFAVAAAATGSCVLKLGLGWLLGESGEIFKILDDPIGDQCHASRLVPIRLARTSRSESSDVCVLTDTQARSFRTISKWLDHGYKEVVRMTHALWE